MDHVVQCRECGSTNIKDESLCLNCESSDIYVDDIPSLAEVMDEVRVDFASKNKPTYDFLSVNEDDEFVEKLLEFAREASDLAHLEEHEQKIIEDTGFQWQRDENCPHDDVILCSYNQTVNGGYLGDCYAGFVYVKLPKSGKVFQFEYSM